ncbi:hypothetical protein Dimus_012745 [Dionaea muscipula]
MSHIALVAAWSPPSPARPQRYHATAAQPATIIQSLLSSPVQAPTFNEPLSAGVSYFFLDRFIPVNIPLPFHRRRPRREPATVTGAPCGSRFGFPEISFLIWISSSNYSTVCRCKWKQSTQKKQT